MFLYTQAQALRDLDASIEVDRRYIQVGGDTQAFVVVAAVGGVCVCEGD